MCATPRAKSFRSANEPGLLALEPRTFIACREVADAAGQKFRGADVGTWQGVYAEFQIHLSAERPVRAGVVPRGQHEIGDDYLRAGFFVQAAHESEQRV